ncbi:MAG: glycosyltransferase family 4 protein [Paludibacter sp.]
MNKGIFFLKDSEINDWLIDSFKQRNYPINFMGIRNSPKTLQESRLGRIIKLHAGYIRLAINSLIKSNRDDIIVSLLDVLALYLFLISKILFMRREIVVINIMLNDQNDFITKIKRYLFRWMLKNNHIHPTVTSTNLQELYRKLFDLPNKEFYLLHDCYGKLGKYKRSYKNGDKYVFCGGTNGRDWITLLKIAELLPNIKFVIVGPKKDTLGNHYPSNIDYYYDIPFTKFQELIENCSLLALPLKTQAPAGLIVLFTAGLMSKPVITTDNATTREYITTEENGILVKLGDYEEFAKQVNRLISTPDNQELFGKRLFSMIENLGSPQAFVDKVILIIDQIHLNEGTTNK